MRVNLKMGFHNDAVRIRAEYSLFLYSNLPGSIMDVVRADIQQQPRLGGFGLQQEKPGSGKPRAYSLGLRSRGGSDAGR